MVGLRIVGFEAAFWKPNLSWDKILAPVAAVQNGANLFRAQRTGNDTFVVLLVIVGISIQV